MTAHSVLWTSPQPLWGRFGAVGAATSFRAADQARPALLRFASDEFMQQLIAMLEADPRRIGEAIARPETWRYPPGKVPEPIEAVPMPRLARTLARLRAGAAPRSELNATVSTQTMPKVNGFEPKVRLKLYHPAHQRHYLVAANLVCGIPGFPDKSVATGGREQVSFVLRRLLPGTDTENALEREYAYVKDARGPHWELVPRDATAHGEEMLPLFPLNFRDDLEHPRRLLAGLIPVGRREEYMSGRRYESALPSGATPGIAPATDPSTEAATRISARKEQLKLDVTEPWKALIRAMYKAAARVTRAPKDDATTLDMSQSSARQTNEGAQLQSWLILLDFADYLALHVPDVWAAVLGEAPAPTMPGPKNLFDWIVKPSTASSGTWQLPASRFAPTMREALKGISKPGVRDGLEGAESTFVAVNFGLAPWPDFYYLLAGVHQASPFEFTAVGVQDSLASAIALEPQDANDVEASPQPLTDVEVATEAAAARVDKLVQLVMAALDPDLDTPTPPIPFAVQLRDAIQSMQGDPGWFVIRCAYVRCDCGPLEPAVLSVPSQRFQLASFFDSDAPARPIRIALPIDTTAAGMRKHQKNTAFVMSDVLCGQMNRLKGLGFVDLVLSVLPWPFHKDLDIGKKGMGPCAGDLGTICSLSIPIITICALILLFMIVLVLDLIFKWIPWFIVCFQLPKFKAKQ